MKKILFLLSIFSASVALQAENEWKWSVTLGTGVIDYEEDRASKDTSDALTGETSSYSDTYNPGIYGVGLSNGNHTFSYKITSSSASEYDSVYSGEADDYTVSLRERDYEESTMSYQYRLNSAWTLGVAYNDKEHKYTDISSKTYDAPFIPDAYLGAGESADYTWTRNGSAESSQDGFAVYATWQQLFADVWVFAAKIGIAQTDLDNKWQQVRDISGIPVLFNQIYIDNDLGSVNGSTVTYAGADKGDASTVYGGISIVRIFPSAPNHQIIFSMDSRSDDLAGSSVMLINGVGTGYFAADNDTSGVDAGEAIGGSDTEEDNFKYTLEYKYTF
tara:strand:- start:2225 stop:3220 length:996 start_codon:yes stop_codon:yes gene_type:complete